MDLKNIITPNVIMVIFAIILLGRHADAQAPHPSPSNNNNNNNTNSISPFCTGKKYLDDSKPSLEKLLLCTKFVQGAKTWEEAAQRPVDLALKMVKKSWKPLLAIIKAKLAPSISQHMKSDIMRLCFDNFEQAIEALEESKKSIKYDWWLDLGPKVGIAYTSLIENKYLIMEENGQPEIVELTNFLKQIDTPFVVAIMVAQSDPRLLVSLPPSPL